MRPEVGALLALDGRGALVTGAATGIGEGIAHLLASAGARVVVADIDDVGAARVVADIVAAGGEAFAVHVDVTDASSARDAVAGAAKRTGRLDILVNNAGSYHEAGTILDQSEELWHRSVAINFHGVYHMAKPAAECLVARGEGGTIVNISSVDGLLPCIGTAYDSSKAAVIHFTRSLALDLAPHGIRVNGVAPGAISVETLARMERGELPPLWVAGSKTGLMGPLTRQRSANIPLGRKGTPDDVAQAVLWLVSDASAYVTGQTITVDGGWTIS